MMRAEQTILALSLVGISGCFSPEVPVGQGDSDTAPPMETETQGEATASGGADTGGPGGSDDATTGTGSVASESTTEEADTSASGVTETETDGTDTDEAPSETCSTHILYGRDRVLWMVDVETGQETQVTGSGLPDDDLPFDREFRWHPDGDSVVFRRSAYAGDPQRILSVGLDGGVDVLAESGGGLLNPRNPQFSNDGGELAFVVEAPNAIDAFVVMANADGSNQTVVEPTPFGSFFFAWSGVEFSSTLSNAVVLNQDSLHYLDLPEGSSLGLVQDSPSVLSQADATASGQVIAYVETGDGKDPLEDADIHVINANGSGGENLTSTSPAGSYAPQWSPDGSRIAFTRRVGTDEELFVMDADGSGAQNLSDAAGNDVSHSWAPDGRAMAFVSNRSGSNRLYALTLSSGELLDLGALEVTFPGFDLWRTQGLPRWRPCR